MIKRLSFLLLLASLFVVPSIATAQSQADYDKLVDEFFDVLFQYHPTQGTAAGFHKYDTQLEDFSHSRVDAEIAALTKMQSKLESFDSSKLSETDAADLQILKDTIRARFLELRDIQMWRKDPDQYTSGATYPVFLIMKRNFAPQPERLLVSAKFPRYSMPHARTWRTLHGSIPM